MNDFPWLSKYPSGVEKTITLYEYQSLLEFFDVKFREHSDKVAYENMGATLTYRQLDELPQEICL